MEGKKKKRMSRNEGESVEDRVMKQKNLTREDAVNRQIWRKATGNH
jgi:hypothetical protein